MLGKSHDLEETEGRRCSFHYLAHITAECDLTRDVRDVIEVFLHLNETISKVF